MQTAQASRYQRWERIKINMILTILIMETPQLQDNSSEELYNLDNDSFLNSLEAISFPDTWPEAKL